jgi:hypothetical protein
MTVLAVRTPGRGAHRLPLLRNLARRTARELRRTQPKANAGRAARRAAITAPCIAACGHVPYLPAIITAAIVIGVAAPLGVRW